MNAAQMDRSEPRLEVVVGPAHVYLKPEAREELEQLGDFLDELTITHGITWRDRPTTVSEALNEACPALTVQALKVMWDLDMVTAGGHDLALAWLRCRTPR